MRSPGNFLVMLILLSVWLTHVANAQEFGEVSFIPIPGTPHDVVYDVQRDRAYVSNRSLNQIDIVSLDALSVESSISVGDWPSGLAITPDYSQLIVAI